MNDIELSIDLNTEKWAYIIGLWWADGGLRLLKKRNRLYKTVIFTNTDKQIINDIRDLIGIGSIHCYKSKKPKWSDCYKYRIYSDNLFDYAYTILDSTIKTGNNALPSIPNNTIWHFIRGFFDGDGSIHWANYNNRHGKPARNFRSSFTASLKSLEFLTKLATILTSYGINSHITKSKTNMKLALGQEATERLCNSMYNNATIYMKRKKLIWQNAQLELTARKNRCGDLYHRVVAQAGLEPASS